ncbi:ubiquitin-protein transferase [Aureococcus anophagefferens]|nr:ubiquitin-protein transferase [Aureococcus anophagefferens]
MAEIDGLVRALREGDDAAKTAAAGALGHLAWIYDANRAAIAAAGGIAPLVELLRDGSAEDKACAAWALRNLACDNAANKVLIVEAGGIAPLVELLRHGSMAAYALGTLADNNDANAVAIALTVGFDAVVELVRRGSVNGLVSDAGLPAKRKAALVVAALLRACVPDEARGQVRELIRGVIGPYL